MIEKFKEAFREEAAELLGNLEATLLELEGDPENAELISSVFRTMHTIKGSSAMFGFEAISKFTHEVESIMESLREGAFVADRRFIDLTLQARDLINAMLADGGEPLDRETEDLVKEFKAHTQKRIAEKGEHTEKSLKSDQPKTEPALSSAAPPSAEGPSTPPPSTGPMETYRIRFMPSEDIFYNGTRPLLLLEELGSLGEISLTVLADKIPPLSTLDPEKCYVGWDITLSTDRGENAIRDVFIFVEGSSQLEIERLESGNATEGEVKRVGEILVDRGVTTPERIESLEGNRKRIGELLVEEKIATPDEVKSALTEQEHLKKIKERQEQSGMSSIRVASEKLDALVDLVGELVTLQARLARTTLDIKDGGLSTISEQFERLVSQLRDNTMGIRMLPIGSTFSRFRRLVRDLSNELGKEIELITEGAETELDKTVIEKLNDPLIHIIRNSVDHGIEHPQERLAKGKSRGGTVTLSALHSGAYVLIKIADDGAGLDTEAIYAKAVERGMIKSGTALSQSDMYQLIFAPGFSTAKTVTSVSGRGVGMDVVKRQIDTLGGTIIIDSEKDRGTSITLKIPLTLAIIEGLLVRVATEYYIIPLSVVDGCIELNREQKTETRSGLEKQRRNLLTYRNKLLPYVFLRELFDVPGTEPPIQQIVVANALDNQIGFVVDQVIGDNQTVIKPLGRMFRHSEGLSGATILGDGTVALIVDVNHLAVVAQRNEARFLDVREQNVQGNR
jgi:two-component system chemotaxis sensor kinase CheA